MESELVVGIFSAVGVAALAILGLVHKRTKNTFDDKAFAMLKNLLDPGSEQGVPSPKNPSGRQE